MRVYLEAYGCTMNFAETSMLREAYRISGYDIVESPEDADLVVVGSCVVIEHTERKVLKRIKEFVSMGKRVVVTGCMPLARAELLEGLDVVGIPSVEIEERYEEIGLQVNPYDCIPKLNRVDVAIPIAQGCLGNCSYCITKLARGNLKSKSVDYIVNYARRAILMGYKEIRLTAQDTGDYGKDIGTDIAELVKRVSSLEGDFRIRVGMMSPQPVQRFKRILDVFDNEKVYKFFHIPVQSGDDDVLKDMGRRYTVDDFLYNVEMIKERFENYTLSTDIIVGYPTEDENSFKKSMKIVEKTSPNIVNITRFSPRPGTRAFRYKPLPGRVVKRRSRELTKLVMKIGLKNNLKLLGKDFNVLIVENGRGDSMLSRTDFYRPVVLKGKLPIGTFTKAKIVGITNAYLIGKEKKGGGAAA